MNADNTFGAGFFCGALIAGILCTLTFACYAKENRRSWEEKSIENGAAHYDAKTGAFTWKNEVTE